MITLSFWLDKNEEIEKVIQDMDRKYLAVIREAMGEGGGWSSSSESSTSVWCAIN